MYGFVPYNISSIQKGIQFGHAVVEYSNLYGEDADYREWSRIDKTFIILNGGTTNVNSLSLGSLNQHASALRMIYKVKTAEFYEPDLGDQLTAVVFLVDDRVWDSKNFPDYTGSWITSGLETKPMEPDYSRWLTQFSENREEAEECAKLRNFLGSFKLA